MSFNLRLFLWYTYGWSSLSTLMLDRWPRLSEWVWPLPALLPEVEILLGAVTNTGILLYFVVAEAEPGRCGAVAALSPPPPLPVLALCRDGC